MNDYIVDNDGNKIGEIRPWWFPVAEGCFTVLWWGLLGILAIILAAVLLFLGGVLAVVLLFFSPWAPFFESFIMCGLDGDVLTGFVVIAFVIADIVVHSRKLAPALRSRFARFLVSWLKLIVSGILAAAAGAILSYALVNLIGLESYAMDLIGYAALLPVPPGAIAAWIVSKKSGASSEEMDPEYDEDVYDYDDDDY